jgi:hypothetical protein
LEFEKQVCGDAFLRLVPAMIQEATNRSVRPAWDGRGVGGLLAR